jgi:hypothetical protein
MAQGLCCSHVQKVQQMEPVQGQQVQRVSSKGFSSTVQVQMLMTMGTSMP